MTRKKEKENNAPKKHLFDYFFFGSPFDFYFQNFNDLWGEKTLKHSRENPEIITT